MTDDTPLLVLNPDKKKDAPFPRPLTENGAPPLPESRTLLEGTPDVASENEYVVAMGAKIVQHACRIMPMKVKLPNGSYKKVPMLCLNEHALAHVLKVFFSGAEVTDEALTWNPKSAEKVTGDQINIMRP